MKGFLDSIRRLGMVRVAMLMGVTLGIIGAFVWLELQGPSRARMTMLASDLDPQSAQQIVTELTARKIPYRLDGGQIFVPDSDLATARTLSAVNGASAGNITGYEIFTDGSWVCYRLSGTEPVVRVYTEARSENESAKLSAAATPAA